MAIAYPLNAINYANLIRRRIKSYLARNSAGAAEILNELDLRILRLRVGRVQQHKKKPKNPRR